MTNLIDDWAAEIHLAFPDHLDPKSGLSKDCPRCRELAIRLIELQVQRLMDVGIMEDEPLSFSPERLAN